jgi:membrane protein implicated in regulation of membrane protease activity
MKIKQKLVSGSFWLIVAIHVIVFTTIGLFSAKGWRLLIVFLSGLSVLLLLFWFLRLYSKKHPEKKQLAAFLSKITH